MSFSAESAQLVINNLEGHVSYIEAKAPSTELAMKRRSKKIIALQVGILFVGVSAAFGFF